MGRPWLFCVWEWSAAKNETRGRGERVAQTRLWCYNAGVHRLTED